MSMLQRFNQELLELCTAQAQGALSPAEFRRRRRELLGALAGDSVTVPGAVAMRRMAVQPEAEPAASAPTPEPPPATRRPRWLALIIACIVAVLAAAATALLLR